MNKNMIGTHLPFEPSQQRTERGQSEYQFAHRPKRQIVHEYSVELGVVEYFRGVYHIQYNELFALL